MKRLRAIAFCLSAWAVSLASLWAQPAVDENRYAWEFPVARHVQAPVALLQTLREEIQRVLEAGRLAPLYISTSDQDSVGYTIYNEPGRIITTLAWAYPHLTSAQQAAVRTYVAQEFANPVFSPWGVTAQGKNGNTNFPLPREAGSPREDHPKERWWHARNDFGINRPFLHTLYGAWLYGFRSGDWSWLSAAWPAIRQRYLAYAGEPAHRLYGTMGAHIAAARLAHRAGDASTRNAALTNLRNALTTGLDLAAVEALARGTPGQEWRSPYGSFPDMYDSRMNGTTYRGWIFLNLVPEIGRYLAEESPALRAAVLARHEQGRQTFPLWWLNKASYFNRSWTGDEGSGLLPEIIGMMAPVERWVAAAPPQVLARQARGSPQGIGDCYWLEALTQAIEAHGETHWRDVRYDFVPFETWRQSVFGAQAGDPQAAPEADWDGDGLANLLERALGTDPLSPNPTPTQAGRTADGRHLTLTYLELKEAWDITYVVESSGDLVQWRSGPGHTVLERVEDLGATRRVTVRDAARLDEHSRRFLRLRVSLSP